MTMRVVRYKILSMLGDEVYDVDVLDGQRVTYDHAFLRHFDSIGGCDVIPIRRIMNIEETRA